MSNSRLGNIVTSKISALGCMVQFGVGLKLDSALFRAPTIPPYYYLGQRSVQILHCRLRHNMSNLNDDLLKRHLTLNPACSCGHPVENTKHYLMECRHYTTLRQETILTLPANSLTTQILLYGNSSFSVQENTNIFKVVHDYIIKTNRF